METRDFLHNPITRPFPAKISTESRRGWAAAAATSRPRQFGVVANLAGARRLSRSAGGDAHHINAVGIHVGDHIIHGVKIVLALFLEWGWPWRRWSTASRTRTGTPSHAHLLLPKLQLSLAKGQLALPNCQVRRRRSRPTGGESVATIGSIGVIVHHQMAEFFQAF